MDTDCAIVTDLLEGLGGWRLLFDEDSSSVHLKSSAAFSGTKKMKRALVMIFEREVETGRDLQLLVRAAKYGAVPKESTWLSMSCKYPQMVEYL